MSLLSFLGFGKNKIKESLRYGAIVIDVRIPNEFDNGKVAESINIPLERIPVNKERIKSMNRPVIFCCNSGYQSGIAVRIMKEAGLKEVYNGGNWANLGKLKQKI